MKKRYCDCGCNQMVEEYTRFVGRSHEREYFKTHDSLPCQCGCGQAVKWNGQRYPRYIDGHQNKPHVDWQERANEIEKNAPYCLCGCGSKVHVNKKKVISDRKGSSNYKYPKYLIGHGIRRVNQAIDLTQDEKDLIIGTSMGDGSIQYPHGQSKFPRMVINHGQIQHAYNCIKASVIARFNPSVKIVKNGGYGDYTSNLMTCCHRLFEPIYYLFYKTVDVRRKKRITKELYPFLNGNVLMWWYLDDGSRISKRDSEKFSITISTEGFIKEDVFLLSEMIQEKFRIASIPSKSKKYWCLRFNQLESEMFMSLFFNRVPTCMAYKVGL